MSKFKCIPSYSQQGATPLTVEMGDRCKYSKCDQTFLELITSMTFFSDFSFLVVIDVALKMTRGNLVQHFVAVGASFTFSSMHFVKAFVFL